ncbi:MAG: LysM peptidoglycan-binding domain-containing protein [Bacteroidales bacterium]|nr:LysM peptidoglycan-binding domain-containing protein [Bacteroidales bacterium]
MQFDNLINIIKSRQTIENTAIRLLAQDLSLEHPDPEFISKKSYKELQRIVPEEVKDLVVKNNRSGQERKKAEQINLLEEQIHKLENQLSDKKEKIDKVKNNEQLSNNNTQTEIETKSENNFIFHTVQPGESISLIASKYGVSIGELKYLNHLTSDQIAEGEKLIIAYSPVKIKKSPKTEDKTKTPQIIYSEKKILPDYISMSDYEKTVKNLTEYYHQNDTNFVYELLNYDHKHYSIKAISANAKIYRISNSDLVRVSYTLDDPGICQQTLKLLTEVFILNYKFLKEVQTDAVLNYFQEQVAAANKRLKDAEDRLLKFNQDNNIINYYEQSKYIAVQKEDLDKYYQDEQIRLSSAAAALKKIESKLTVKDSIYLKSDEISKNRDKLSAISEKIIINEISNNNDPLEIQKLKKLQENSEKIKNKIKEYVDQLYLYSNTTEGIPIKDLLTNWLKNALTYEEAKASLRVLSGRKLDFLKTYQIFAPLGATLKRIEREISIEEKSYLENLRSLNLAKMKQQNLAMSSNMKIVDEPYFPIAANPSKTKLLILLAAFAGFIIIAFIILLLEYTDTSIRTPEHVEKLTKLKLAGAYPFINDEFDDKLNNISDRLIEMIIQNIYLKLIYKSNNHHEKPFLILVFSTQDQTGKTYITNKIIKALQNTGEKTLYLNYTKNKLNNISENNNHKITYTLNNKFYETKNIGDLFNKKSIREKNYHYDYIFVEIPSLIFNPIPIDLMSSIDLPILFVSANHHWRKADISALNILQDVSLEKPLLVLNNTELFALEDVITKIPQKSKTFKTIKNILTFPFKIRVNFGIDKRENK